MNNKKWMSILLCLMLVFTCITPVFADTAATEWTAEDFTYGEEIVEVYSSDHYSTKQNLPKWVVTGFSEAGKAKFETNKDLVIPAKDPNGKVVQGIAKNAFIGTSKASFGIKSVKFPENVKTKDDGVWKTDFERGDFYIGYAAFRYNDITELVLPEGVIVLGTYAFGNNALLESVTFPETLMILNSGAFYKCGNLKTANFPDKTVLDLQLDMTVFASTAITSVEMPSNIMRLPKTLFNSCPVAVVKIYVSEIPNPTIQGSGKQTWEFVKGKDPNKINNLADKASLNPAEATYTGSAIEPAVTIEGLTAGTDFTVEYKDNINSGDATAVVKGAGTYYGSLELQFKIKAKDINDVKDKASLEFTEVEYTGGEFQPAVSIEGLTYGEDYSVAWGDNVNPGTAKAVVTGIGNYEGTFELEFEIKAPATDDNEGGNGGNGDADLEGGNGDADLEGDDDSDKDDNDDSNKEENDDADKEDDKEIPETGDNAPLALMFGLMLVAAAGGYTAYRKNYTK